MLLRRGLVSFRKRIFNIDGTPLQCLYHKKYKKNTNWRHFATSGSDEHGEVPAASLADEVKKMSEEILRLKVLDESDG